MEYTTVQGQTWDMIAKEVYGDEKYAGYLMQVNNKLLDYFIFPAGVVLAVPELPDDEQGLPPWRT